MIHHEVKHITVLPLNCANPADSVAESFSVTAEIYLKKKACTTIPKNSVNIHLQISKCHSSTLLPKSSTGEEGDGPSGKGLHSYLFVIY